MTQPLSAAQYLKKILLAPVYEAAVETPLQPMTKLSKRLNNHILLKREDRQPVHSFKLRGAYNKLASLSAEQKACGVIAASAGNHAQGVAFSAKKMAIKATIVMPKTTPDIKVSSVRLLGADVILHGESFDAASEHCKELAAEHNYTLIHPFDDSDVIAGQGTIAKELIQQNVHLDKIFVPVGGGGLAAGIAVYIKQLLPHIKIIAVEPEDAASLKVALDHGGPITLSKVGLFADGVAVKTIGTETFRLCQQYVDEVITVNSDEICAAVKDIFEDTRAIAEPAGALSLAGLKKYSQQHQLENEQLAAILSGANVNFHGLRYVSERCELGEQKESILAVTIPERQGAFLTFCNELDGRAITEFNYRFNSRKEANIFVGVRTPQGAEELAGLTDNLTTRGYRFADLSHDEVAKLHLRYMVGGAPVENLTERLYSFEFPEHPNALVKFLNMLGTHANITLFHYRNHGAAYGQVLAGFEVKAENMHSFNEHLEALGYNYKDETDNQAYRFFLANK
ncbi:threonine ammonia-lyase, biosynthetic [Psychromonas sp. Urea-02u-13]|uniref:threonine ammonia-lyase, biosynthetic n=1 Tax=Psychromonas sp. Urea-02u-13 TaxID=2058326 RepID=UPI000C3355E6|nr:threonine ammonia-lyase, biosynthetic [Psychromonas sp. Urea-02u-13]PKG39671.1 threonine ammonia-lyase, biosynthetic [Psychromonas sp. Urea-02u-13]